MSIPMVKCPDGINRPVSEDHPLPVAISTGTNPSAQTQAGVSGLAIPAHDFADLSYTGGNLTSVAYKKGGADVGTMTLTYTADGKIDTYTVAPTGPPPPSPAPGGTTATGGSTSASGTSHQTRSLDAWHPPTPYDFFASVRSTNYGDLDDSVTNASVDPSGKSFFASVVLLPDGRVLCLPAEDGNTLAKIYNPKTSLWASAKGAFPEGNFLGGGAALLQDGRVFVLPWNGVGVAIYDPVVDVLTASAATTPNPHLFSGAVALQDGRIFCVPVKSATALIYDPASDKFTTPSGTYPTTGYSFMGGVLMGDGKVLCVPADATVAAIYDPVSDSVTTTPANSFPGGFGYRSGVLLTDGRVLCVPHNAKVAKIYDPATGSITDQTAHFPGGSKFTSGLLLPNGKVFLTPNNSTKGGIYDPVTDTLTPTTSVIPNHAIASALLMDGRVFCLSGGSDSSQIYGNPLPQPLPLARVLSAYDNHG